MIHHEGFILLCGGPTDVKKGTLSVRDYLLHKLPTISSKLADADIQLAEDINDWYREDTYKDLICFEKDIAQLAGLVVIFLESAGAIAELSAFSQVPVINKKLQVFIDETHERVESFIVLGPIKYIQRTGSNSVHIYKWMDPDPIKASQNILHVPFANECIEEIANDISDALKKQKNGGSFKEESDRHAMLLTCDLIDLMLALTKKEIRAFLSNFNIRLNVARLKQILFILIKFGFVSEKKRGNETFYISLLQSPLVKYKSTTPGIPIDRQRYKALIREHYMKNDRNRFMALKDIIRQVEART